MLTPAEQLAGTGTAACRALTDAVGQNGVAAEVVRLLSPALLAAVYEARRAIAHAEGEVPNG